VFVGFCISFRPVVCAPRRRCPRVKLVSVRAFTRREDPSDEFDAFARPRHRRRQRHQFDPRGLHGAIASSPRITEVVIHDCTPGPRASMRPRHFTAGCESSLIQSLKTCSSISAHFPQIFHLFIRTVLRYVLSITRYAIKKILQAKINTLHVSNSGAFAILLQIAASTSLRLVTHFTTTSGMSSTLCIWRCPSSAPRLMR
jgi:hypothetical protein